MAYTIEPYSGDGQVVARGWPTEEPLKVLVKQNGLPAVGETVTWSVDASEGSVYPLTSNTDGSGIAETTFSGYTMITPAQSWITAYITATGPTGVETTMYATTTTRTISGMTVWPTATLVSPSELAGLASATLTDAIVVTVTAVSGSESGHGIPYVAVYLRNDVASPTAELVGDGVPPYVLTTAAGATASVALGGTPGGPESLHVIVGEYASLSLPLTIGGDFSGLYLFSGDGQSGSINTELELPLIVRVLQVDGSPAVGESISWAVTAGTATISDSTVTTDAEGKAEAVILLGGTAGAVTVQATWGVTTVDFSATIETIIVTKEISVYSGNSQTADVSAAFADELVVLVMEGGAPCVGETVNFTVNYGSVTLGASSDTTDGDGYASISVTAGLIAGPAQVTAAVADSSTVFSLTVSGAVPEPSDYAIFPEATLSLSGQFMVSGAGEIYGTATTDKC